jgi:hypothetical protein
MKALIQFIRLEIRRRRYLRLRKLLMLEMISAGWKDGGVNGRLVHDHILTTGTRLDVADHEAVSLHMKLNPLRK